jgi:hypothetical protein
MLLTYETFNIMRPTFNQTVDVLANAYLNDTLVVGNDCACAVGNLIAHGMGLKYKGSFWDGRSPSWYMAYILDAKYMTHGNYREELEATGYTPREIVMIESAFETGAKKSRRRGSESGSDEEMFDALMAVVDVLSEIHEVPLEQKEEAKLLFV